MNYMRQGFLKAGPMKMALVAAFALMVLLASSIADRPEVASAHGGRHGDTVKVTGVVLILGWTPPGIAEVQLCAREICQTTSTDNLGRFEFHNVVHSTTGYIKAGYNCSWERWINDPFFDTVDVHLLSCML